MNSTDNSLLRCVLQRTTSQAWATQGPDCSLGPKPVWNSQSASPKQQYLHTGPQARSSHQEVVEQHAQQQLPQGYMCTNIAKPATQR